MKFLSTCCGLIVRLRSKLHLDDPNDITVF